MSSFFAEDKEYMTGSTIILTTCVAVPFVFHPSLQFAKMASEQLFDEELELELKIVQ